MKLENNPQGAAGFTLTEMLVAITVAGILTGIAIPNFMSWLPGLRLSSAARQVATDLQVTRMKAVSQNNKFRLSFVGSIPGATTYQIQKANGGTFVAESGPFALPPGITVTVVSATSEFQPRGTANTASTITLQNSDGQTQNVQIAVVGRVTVP